ncbi:redoxin domain-containing protein [Chitinophaga sp. SYP-B3965]|uniref:TlpA disulfide reductase family protein n=1 Tax=Chitinophaga sp. SYP-B3965 TaxID=2663120 RepID=UPI0012995FC8|nr:TlpA disulfide reductase family protein [Chitinophaga sp. SYP-B3965]MRG45669.1 redoxin domain-containing protein [Chitinophaga sp. SYP-B3965]
MKRLLFITLAALAACGTQQKAQLATGPWQAHLLREDGGEIVFNFEVLDSAGKKTLYIINAGDRMLVDDVRQEGDSVLIRMPFFDNEFRTVLQADGSLQGLWIRHLADKDVSIAFKAKPGISARFDATHAPQFNISGRWPTYFTAPDGTDSSFAIGEFSQNGINVQGTFLTTTGDYRYLQGVVDGDSLKLSTFDGSHAYQFIAVITNDSTIGNGVFYQGITNKEIFTARKDSSAKLQDATTLATVKEAGAELDFSFPDLNGEKVSIKDERFKDKVVIVQIGGSWCPNCMDETAYLSEWYKQNKDRGVEIIMLCYERTTDFEKSKKAAGGFAKRFDITYPVLLTGVTPADPKKAEKTLPQLTGIKGFPTTIYIDKSGKVKEVHTGFNGPGTGEHYEEYKKAFNALIDGMLK